MAWTEFYLDTGGNSSNVNAGSGTANTAATVTNTNGNWSTTTNVFTPSGGGTPFSGVTANVDWASIYVDAAAVTPFIARVASVNSGGATITLDTTIRLGTPPVTSATARSCKIGGSWSNFALLTSGPFAAGTAGVPMRINVALGTYANTTTLRTIAATGATNSPIWFRGYSATPGDLDNVANATRPELTFTTGRITCTSPHLILSNINFTTTGAASNFTLSVAGASTWVDRCRIDNQHATGASYALFAASAVGIVISNCYLKATSSATRAVNFSGQGCTYVGCYITGGNSGVETTGGANIRNCIITGTSTNGFIVPAAGANGSPRITNCTVYNTVNGVNCTSVVAGISVEDCLFHTLTNGINNSSGTNTGMIHRHNNAFYNVTNVEVGLGDSPSFGNVTESSNPLVNPGAGDFTLVDGALSQGTATPITYEFLALASNFDRGAVQALATSGGGVSRARLPSGLSAVG